jgi:HEAT repeat protein
MNGSPRIPETELEAPDARQASLAGEVLSLLVRALKDVRLYPIGHRVVEAAITDFQVRLETYFEEYGDLILGIRRSTIEVGGLTVHDDAQSEHKLAMQLTLESVREITFHDSVTEDEIERFLAILSQVGRRSDEVDDLDTLLWQEDLQGISVDILDMFYDDVGDEEEFLEFIEEGQADPQAGAIAATEHDEIVEVLGDAPQLLGDATQGLGILDDEDRLQIEFLLTEAERRDHMTTFGAIIVDVLGVEDEPEAFEKLCSVLSRLMRILVEQKEILRAAQVAREVDGLLSQMKDEEHRRHVSEALESFPMEAVLGELADAVAEADEVGLGDLRALLSRLAMRDPDSIVKLLERSELRDLAMEALADHLDRLVPFLAARVNDPRPAVVLAVVRLLGGASGANVVDILVEAARHADARVRVEAVRAADGVPEARGSVEQALEDEDEEVRLAALRSPAAGRDEAILERIKKRATTKHLANASFLEKREVYHALARSGREEIVEFLARVLKRRPLFGRDRADEVRACAASALGAVGSAAAIEILERFLEDSSGRVRDAVFGALRDASRRGKAR